MKKKKKEEEEKKRRFLSCDALRESLIVDANNQ